MDGFSLIIFSLACYFTFEKMTEADRVMIFLSLSASVLVSLIILGKDLTKTIWNFFYILLVNIIQVQWRLVWWLMWFIPLSRLDSESWQSTSSSNTTASRIWRVSGSRTGSSSRRSLWWRMSRNMDMKLFIKHCSLR